MVNHVNGRSDIERNELIQLGLDGGDRLLLATGTLSTFQLLFYLDLFLRHHHFLKRGVCESKYLFFANFHTKIQMTNTSRFRPEEMKVALIPVSITSFHWY